MKKLLQTESDFEILDIYQSDDVREGRPRWLNVLVKKEGGEEDELRVKSLMDCFF